MTTGPLARVVLLLAIAVAALALAGCEASVSTGGGIDSDEVAAEAQTQLNKVSEEEGLPPFPKITCPDELEEDVGSTTTCYSTFDGSRHKVRVKVTGNENDKVQLDFESEGRPSK
jgi:hypothetical protein